MTNSHIGTSLDEWVAETFTPEEHAMIDETIHIFAQSRVILERYHDAIRQAQPPNIVTNR